MLLYILKFSACLGILLLFYRLFLERENMHVFKRFYLLGALVFSLIVPQLVFTEYVVGEPAPKMIVEPTTDVVVQPMAQPTDVIEIPPTTETDVFDVATILWGLYFLGLIFFGLNFIKNLVQVYRRIKANPKERKVPFIRVLLRETFPPHTFFNYIFLNKVKFESDEIPEEVLLHEESHAKQKHSIDVLFIELLQVAMWFNPLVHFARKSIKLNHEFLADSEVLKKGTDSSTYQNTLLSFIMPKNQNQPLANAINYSSIKKRFTVMKKITSKKSILIRSLLLPPLLATMVFGFSETRMVTFEKEPIAEANSYEDGPTTTRNMDSENSSTRSVELAGLILDSETLKPIEDVEIYNSNGNVISKTDHRGYYKAKFDVVGQGEIRFEFSLHKDGYKTLAQREHWGDLQGKLAFTNYYGLQKKESDALEFSQHLPKPNNGNLSYSSVLYNFNSVKTRFEFNKKLEKAKKGNQHILFEIDNAYYLINNSGLIRINSKDNLISIDDNRVVRASEINGLIEREAITGMTPLDGKNAHYAIYTIPVDYAVRPIENQVKAEGIIIKINRKGQLLLKERLLSIGNLKKALLEINNDLTFEERKVSVRAIVIADPDTPEKTLIEIDQILESYGVAQIDIRGPESMLPPVQNGATQKQLTKYNGLAKKYNAQPKEKRVIPSDDLKSLELIYRKMSERQKANAQPFPECADPRSSNQEGATQRQMAEYNALAEKYNTMLAESKSILIKKLDVDRLEYLQGIMTEAQRAAAEPFPDFPEPPEPPMPPAPPKEVAEEVEIEVEVEVNEIEEKEIEVEFEEADEIEAIEDVEIVNEVIEEIIAHQDPYDVVGNNVYFKTKKSSPVPYPKSNSFSSPQDKEVAIPHFRKKNGTNDVGQSQKTEKNASVFNYTYKPESSDDVSNPPPPPAPPKAPKTSKNSKAQKVRKGEKSNIPPPPTPKSPLDHVIEMAKKEARFYYEGKEISSDKAIDLMKKNKSFNIDSKTEKGKRPVVKLSTEPFQG